MKRLRLALATALGLLAVTAEAPAQVSVQPRDIIFVPDRLTRGDREFGGHGPRVDLEVSLRINPGDAREVQAVVTMRAEETGGDGTTVEGIGYFPVYRSTSPLSRILTPTFFNHNYTDRNHDDDLFTFRAGMVRGLRYIGDTRGQEAGTRTSVTIHFHEMLVQ
jgi:hypothetical protein